MWEIVFSFVTLSLLEVLLGIDNLVVLSILVGKLEDKRDQKIARNIGLTLSLVMRIAFLFMLTWLMSANKPLWSWGQHSISVRGVILIVGGLFLIYRGVKEIDLMFDQKQSSSLPPSLPKKSEGRLTLFRIILEIAFLDLLFAFDSIVTSVGLSNHLTVMIAANVFAIIFMLLLVQWISVFLKNNPAFKVLALSFLILVGFSLFTDGLGLSIPKGYLYFGIGFALFVEILNTLLKTKGKSSPPSQET